MPAQWQIGRIGALCAVLSGSLAAAGSANASPAVDGTRNLSLGNASRASASGTNAALINPAAMSFSQQFSVEPLYQLKIQNRQNGVGMVVMDSLNNPRFALGLGYLFMKGSPEIDYDDSAGERQELELSHFGHEALLAVSVAIVKQWLALGLKPKYQYSSLRYRDDLGVARNANKKLNSFGLDTSLTLNVLGFLEVAAVAYNLVGNLRPAYTEDRDVEIEGIDIVDDTIDHNFMNRVSDYPLMFAHGLAVFPLRNPNFSLNFDGTYDFTSYWKQNKYTRKTYGGSGEFVIGPVPLRAGSYWDSRGKGSDDDRVYVTGGIGFIRPAKVGGVGVDVGFGFSQQVSGDRKETMLGLHIGLRIHPDL